MEELIATITSWLQEAGHTIRQNLHASLEIETKSMRTDLVTNMDRQTQHFLVKKIKDFDPQALILGEENGQDQTDISKGRVFVIDPIDGTMNFVMQKENFCILLAMYEEGVGKLGFMYDVMQEELYWGGRGLGVFCNQKQLTKPQNKALFEGLVGLNAYMHAHNAFHGTEIGEESMGVRITGCAGLELIALLKGTQISYMSRLSPWDYAAGIILLNEFDMKFSTLDFNALSFKKREPFVAGTPAAYQRIKEIITE
jgi:myo-inositol-1(or 4)-monophosphatase